VSARGVWQLFNSKRGEKKLDVGRIGRGYISEPDPLNEREPPPKKIG